MDTPSWFSPVAAAAIVAVAVSGCAGSTSVGPGGEPDGDSGTAPTTAAPSVARGLPDGVPVPEVATLAAPAATIPNAGKVDGWTAVALTGHGTSPTAIATGLRDSLTKSGWSVTVKGTETDGLGIFAKAPGNAPTKWLNISVTRALPNEGPAITYRYVQAAAPMPDVTPSALTSTTSLTRGRQ